MSLYLVIVLLTLAGPLALSFEKNLMLYKRWKYLLPAILISLLLFGAWDIIFTHMEYWVFNPKYNSGIYIFKLPLEEYLFFISIPYACAFSYYAIVFHFPRYKVGKKATRIISLILIIASLALAFTNMQRIYTFVNFTVLAIVIIAAYIFTREILQYYLAIFPILLIPFFVVNGILTGTGIDQEVFSYSPSVITGIHILTVPLEDMFYAFSLLLSVIALTGILEAGFKKQNK
jgi:lycopene cyclase domain-containing protein